MPAADDKLLAVTGVRQRVEVDERSATVRAFFEVPIDVAGERIQRAERLLFLQTSERRRLEHAVDEKRMADVGLALIHHDPAGPMAANDVAEERGQIAARPPASQLARAVRQLQRQETKPSQMKPRRKRFLQNFHDARLHRANQRRITRVLAEQHHRDDLRDRTSLQRGEERPQPIGPQLGVDPQQRRFEGIHGVDGAANLQGTRSHFDAGRMEGLVDFAT